MAAHRDAADGCIGGHTRAREGRGQRRHGRVEAGLYPQPSGACEGAALQDGRLNVDCCRLRLRHGECALGHAHLACNI